MKPILEINSLCVSCDLCRLICPESAIQLQSQNYIVDQWSCTLCLLCVESCPTNAIKVMMEKQEF